MNKIAYCIVVADDVNLNVEVRSDDWYKLYPLLSNLIKDTLYPGRTLDICSTELTKDEFGNIVFKYKAVPATASTMSSFPHYYALVIKEDNVIK